MVRKIPFSNRDLGPLSIFQSSGVCGQSLDVSSLRAFLPVHPGAAEFYNGTQQSFLDKWSNAIFLAPMALGALATVVAAAWQFLRSGEFIPKEPAQIRSTRLGAG
jgi:hypothetical protein